MPAAEHDIPTKIFLGNLSLETDEKKLREVFAKMGPIEQIMLMRDKESGLSRGFAFITYQTPADAKDAVSRMKDAELDGKFIKVDMALKGIKQQTMAARGGPSGRGMDRGRGGFRGRGGPPSQRGRSYDSYPMDRPLLSGPPGPNGPSTRGSPHGRGGPGGRGGPTGGPPSRGGPMASRGGYSSRGGPHSGPPIDREEYPRSASAVPRAAPSRTNKEPLLSAPPANAMGAYRPRGYDRAYEREPEPRREHAPHSAAYDAEDSHGEPRRRAYPEDTYGAAPASARPSRSGYDDPPADSYGRERYPPAREEGARRAYPEREGYNSRDTRDPYPPPHRDSYSSAAASRPSYDYSLPASREAPTSQREYQPATARTASRYEDERSAPLPRGYERAPAREYPGERGEAAYGREYEREPAASRPAAYSESYGRPPPARASEREYAGSASAAARYDPYASRESYADARPARPAEKTPYGARDSYPAPSAAGGRGSYPPERAARPLDRNGGAVPPTARAPPPTARAPPPTARAPPPSRGYERY